MPILTQTHSVIQKYLAGYRGLSQRCWLGIGMGFFESVLASVFYYLSYYFVYVLHISIATAGIIIACYGVGAIFGGIISGKLSDRFGAHQIASLSLLLQGIGYLSLLIITNPHYLMINLFMVGIASYGFLTANYLHTLNACRTEHERLQAISLIAAASNLGMGIAGFLIGAFAIYGYHNIFMIVGSLLIAMPCYQLLNDMLNRRSNQQNTLIQNQDDTLTSSTTPPPRQYGLLCVALLCVLTIGAIVAQGSTTYSIYLQEKFPAMGIAAVSYLFALNSFLIVFFQAPITHACRQLNKVTMVGLGSFLTGLGMCVLAIGHCYVFAILSCLIYTLGEVFFFSSVQLVCYQAGATKKKGQSLGLYRMTYATSRVLGPALGGAVYANFGGDVIWVASLVLGVGCWGVCWKFKMASQKA